jgi:hypothetical protein
MFVEAVSGENIASPLEKKSVQTGGDWNAHTTSE